MSEIRRLRPVSEAETRGVSKESSISRVLHALREDIIAVALEPGSKLPIGQLAERYDAGPGAVRESLSRLVAEGLVTAADQRGFSVSTISLATLRDIMSVRVMVECEALARAIANGDANWEADLLAAAHRLEKCEQIADEAVSTRWRELHLAFHRVLIEPSDSPTLLRIQENLYAQTERYRCLRAKIGGAAARRDKRDVVKEHRRITEAALNRDTATACAELANHYNLTVTMLENSGLF